MKTFQRFKKKFTKEDNNTSKIIKKINIDSNNNNNNENINNNNENNNNKLRSNMNEITTKKYTKDDLLDTIASFRETPIEKRNELFIKKLKLCCIKFDFEYESAKENLGKEMKRQILLELVEYITTNKGWFNEIILNESINMISINLFRSLILSSDINNNNIFDPDEDDPQLDIQWPHLQIIYEYFLRFIVSNEPDIKLLKKKLNGNFILLLLNIFKSEDPREREYLKTILHRIYGKFMALRSFIRKSINNVFYNIIYYDEKHYGISELLEILGSIINGFALPLKLEHKNFLRNILIPLHKIDKLNSFHQQLSYCITQFIDKENSLAPVVIGGLLKYWPITSSSKEVLLLSELEEIIETTQINEIEPFLELIFKRLALSIKNPHFQVSERALFYWHNELITQLTRDYKDMIFPLIVPSLLSLNDKHWNNTVSSLSINVTKLLNDIDTQLYSKQLQNYQNNNILKENIKNQRKNKWDIINQIANESKSKLITNDNSDNNRS